MKRTGLFALAALTLALTACGGGGGSSGASSTPSTPNPAVAGFWKGTSSNNRTLATLTFQDGQFWSFYTPVGATTGLAGLVQANGSVSGTTISSSSAEDFNFEFNPSTFGFGVLSATFTSKASYTGSFSESGGSLTLNGTYDTNFDAAPSLTTLAGTYSGSLAIATGTETATVAISTGGVISGTSASGCTYTGTAAPRTDGNAYDVSITYGGTPCNSTVANTTATGPAYLETTNRLYLAALNSARNNGFIFTGTK